jgi:hypothetical protein
MDNIIKGVLFLCGVDILFNEGRVTREVICLFKIRAKKLKIETTSEEELNDLMFGC